MKIYFLRHGQTKLNAEGKLNGQIDEALTSLGFEQAEAASLAMPRTIKRIYTSSMLRAVQTAEVVGQAIKVPVSKHDELREINMGSIAGRSWSDPDLGDNFKRIHRAMQFDYRSIGGESVAEFTARIVGFMGEINTPSEDYEALIVAHGGVQRLLHLMEYGNENQSDIENAVLLEFDLSKILENPERFE